MTIDIVSNAHLISVRWGNVIAEISNRDVCIAHLGCKQLAATENVPDDLKQRWTQKIGPGWRKK
jgi:hypothetical protein